MTIHSAKGLEWDTVSFRGATRFEWPGAICSRCERAGICSRSARGCRIVDAKKMPDGLIGEMGLLYVGVTRGRKAVYVSASMQRRTNNGNYQVACPSCLTSLPGIEPVSWTVMDGEGSLNVRRKRLRPTFNHDEFCGVIRARFDNVGQWGNRGSPNMLVKQNLLLISNRYSICMGFRRVQIRGT